MEFSIDKKRHRTENYYAKTSIDMAYLFAKKCHEECRDMVKAIVLFGSTARKKQGSNDIDILVVIDDISLELTPELIQTYRIIIGKIVKNVSNRLHVTTLKFSAFWEYVRASDPVAINILRDGFPLLDTGFFDPLQHLLYQGRLRPTTESVWAYQARADRTIDNSGWHFLQATVDLYWACIDASHAALMSIGEVPPSPEHVAEMLDHILVKKKLIPATFPNIMRKYYTLQKEITHGKRSELAATEFEKMQTEVQSFVKTLKKFTEKNTIR